MRKKLSESVFLSNDQYLEFLIFKFLCSLSLASVHGESRPYYFMALIKLLTKMEHFSNVSFLQVQLIYSEWSLSHPAEASLKRLV